MKKKIVGIFIVMLLIATAVSAIGIPGDKKIEVKTREFREGVTLVNNPGNDDELDQYQNESNSYAVLCDMYSWAQSFKPSLNILTRVELLLSGTTSQHGIFVSIRSSLSGFELTSISKSPDEIPVYPPEWIEFDFKDIGVTPGETYYIVCEAPGVDIHDSYDWWNYIANLYSKGDAYIGYGGNWDKWTNFVMDFCFKTYGIENFPPNTPVCSYDSDSNELVVTDTDSNGDDIRYGVDWDNDENVDQWTEFVLSGTEKRIDCFDKKGTVGVIAEDEYGAQSDWVLQKSKNKAINPFLLFLERLIERFPILEQILQLIYVYLG